ncbi:TldD/PmbA family protein [Methanocella conradii]|uniref:TldD/PmbA family protein n=1 Tax=Methanocella conradii TaxID=1175444 RepID=UPI00157CAC2F|nr:TldD/PmbA family protein [Methanocella conradii]
MEFYDVRELDGYNISIVYDNGEVDEISEHFFKGGAVRALVGGSFGFTSVDDLEKIGKAIKDAIAIARKLDRLNPRPPIELSPMPKLRKDVYKAKKDPASVPLEDKQRLVKDIEEALRGDLIKSTRVTYSEAYTHNIFKSSEGDEVEFEVYRTGFSCVAVAKDGGAMQMGRSSYFNVGGYEVFDQCDPLKLAEEARKEAITLLRAGSPPAGRFDVILDPELAGVFIHEAVGHAAEADTVLEGDSCIEGMIGSTIGSELVTVRDDPTLLRYGHYPYDSEGVPSQPTTIIEHGVLKSYLNSRETALKFSGHPGNARSSGLMRPVVRMSNTFIENGDMSVEEVFEGVDGVYLKGSRGGQVNTGEGIFQFNAVMGYIVENGQIGKPIRDVSISDSTLRTLKSIVRVANDLEFHSGRCGKAGQAVPVADGSPHILVKDAVVGGSA